MLCPRKSYHSKRLPPAHRVCLGGLCKTTCSKIKIKGFHYFETTYFLYSEYGGICAGPDARLYRAPMKPRRCWSSNPKTRTLSVIEGAGEDADRDAEEASSGKSAEEAETDDASGEAEKSEKPNGKSKKSSGGGKRTVEIKVPDIGGSEGVEIIEVAISEGDEISEEDTLITLESDKASMDVPSPYSGKIVSLSVKEGDSVSEGDLIGTMEIAGEGDDEDDADEAAPAEESDSAEPSDGALVEKGRLHRGPATPEILS